MVVSSRTPEGHPAECPVCGSAVWIEPSDPAGEAPCSICGTLLWFREAGDEPGTFECIEPESYRDEITAMLRAHYAMSDAEIELRLPMPLEGRHIQEYLPLLEFFGVSGQTAI